MRRIRLAHYRARVVVDGSSSAQAVLAALADLAPSAEQRASGLTVPLEYFRWLPVSAAGAFQGLTLDAPTRAVRVLVEREYGERLAAIDQLRPVDRPLRVGWLFVAGRSHSRGDSKRIFHPLVTVPVRVIRTPLSRHAELAAVGDVALTELIPDGPVRHELEERIEWGGGAFAGVQRPDASPRLLGQLGRLRQFAANAAAAAGFDARNLIAAGDHPTELINNHSQVIVAGVGVYVAHETGGTSRAASLRAWIDRVDATWSAFHSVYVGPPPGDVAERPHAVAESPYLLTPAQRSAVERSRDEPVTVVSGAPGTGKSQTVVAMACDALARGESVLVTARSDATVDALVDLFERAPGPEPVVFGSNERRVALARRLQEGARTPALPYAVRDARERLDQATSRRDRVHRECTEALAVERIARDPRLIDDARRSAPALVDGAVDLDQVTELLDRADRTDALLLPRWRSRRAHTRACRLAGVPETVPTAELRRLVDVAGSAAALRRAALPGTEPPEPPYDELLTLEDEVREAAARWLAVATRAEDRAGTAERRAIAALATALRSGRAARREQLKRLDARLTHALPLWVGSLPDVDDLLPHVPALFDLVLVDEASSVDQPLAAPALLRGRRAVVVGDPRQLRHVSFLSDEHRDAVLVGHDIADDAVAATLDVRRNSLFDVAAGAGAVTQLDEHFRCDPHLVEYVAARVYDGAFAVATRSPETQSRDCISARRCDGRRDKTGVVAAEVDHVIAELQGLLRAGERSVGVLTPFRAQADAIEQAVLRTFLTDEIERMDLRVGTVHAFQGNERDVVLISLAIGPDDGAATWRFADDAHLFAVLSTRARRRVVLFHSADPPAGGLLSGYLAQADSPPPPPQPARPLDAWAEGIAAELSSAGLVVRRAYPVGRHVVDICVAGRLAPTAVICSLHEYGAAAHVERHLALRRAGWEILEALPAHWSADRATLIVSVLRRLGSAGAVTTT